MEMYFVNLMMLLCGSLPEVQKAICIYDLTVCREWVNHHYQYESEEFLYKHCLLEEYLGQYDWPPFTENKKRDVP